MGRGKLFGVWDSRPRPDKPRIQPGLLMSMEGVPRLFPTIEMAQAAIDIFVGTTGDDPQFYRVVPVLVSAFP